MVQRQLASESLAAAAASGAQLPEGNPICELGLAATEAAVDLWVTHVSRSLVGCKFFKNQGDSAANHWFLQ